MVRVLLSIGIFGLVLGAQASQLRRKQEPRHLAPTGVLPNAANFFAGKWDPTHDKKNYSELKDHVKAEREAGREIVGKIDKSKLGDINETRYNKEWHREYRPNNCDTYSAGPHVPGDIHNQPCYRNKTHTGLYSGAKAVSGTPLLTMLGFLLVGLLALRTD
jgi:hypothetical protein